MRVPLSLVSYPISLSLVFLLAASLASLILSVMTCHTTSQIILYISETTYLRLKYIPRLRPVNSAKQRCKYKCNNPIDCLHQTPPGWNTSPPKELSTMMNNPYFFKGKSYIKSSGSTVTFSNSAKPRTVTFSNSLQIVNCYFFKHSSVVIYSFFK